VKNNGNKNILVPKCSPAWSEIQINNDKFIINLNGDNLDSEEKIVIHESALRLYEGYSLTPGEEMVFSIKTFWLPRPEHLTFSQAKTIRKCLSNDAIVIALNSYTGLFNAWRHTIKDTRKKYTDSVMSWEDLRKLGYVSYPYESEFVYSTINVSDTDEKRLAAIQKWFCELPSTTDMHSWNGYGFFVNPYYTRQSPYYIKTELPPVERELARSKHEEEYKIFYYSMESLSSEIKERIRQTNQYADDLLKLPDSELSPHMKEFIVLRGFLVELRYADENELSRDKVFDKIVNWIKTSKFKTTWVLVLKESGLPSIENVNHFPQQIVNDYINKLSKIFPKEINATINDLNKEYKNM
jgi:hypothetical protein